MEYSFFYTKCRYTLPESVALLSARSFGDCFFLSDTDKAPCLGSDRGMKKIKKRLTPPETSIYMLVTQMMDTTRSFATKSCEVRV